MIAGEYAIFRWDKTRVVRADLAGRYAGRSAERAPIMGTGPALLLVARC